MQMKTIMRYCLTLQGLPKIKKKSTTNDGTNDEKMGLLVGIYCLWECQLISSFAENMDISQKSRN